jgi:hypothetical protein
MKFLLALSALAPALAQTFYPEGVPLNTTYIDACGSCTGVNSQNFCTTNARCFDTAADCAQGCGGNAGACVDTADSCGPSRWVARRARGVLWLGVRLLSWGGVFL